MKKILMHTCCAPCSTYVIKRLREEGYNNITSYWYNINIHPYAEYKARLDALKQYTEMVNIPLIIEPNYGIKEFTKAVSSNIDGRCSFCYAVRLEKTAKYAKEHGYDAFTTTLLVSPYQKHELIINIATEIAKKYDLEFIYFDFREGFREGQQMARDAGIYMQKYCGCIYSEEDSNKDKINSDIKNSQTNNKKIEKQIRLSHHIQNLKLKPYKNGNKEQLKFIYDLEKECYQKYREAIYDSWNEENQTQLFKRHMKAYSKEIELIYINDELVGFFNGENKTDEENNIYEIVNICIKSDFRNRGIGTAILKEVLFENNDKTITLQCFKENPVIRLYERLGFKKVRETETYVIMKKVN